MRIPASHGRARIFVMQRRTVSLSNIFCRQVIPLLLGVLVTWYIDSVAAVNHRCEGRSFVTLIMMLASYLSINSVRIRERSYHGRCHVITWGMYVLSGVVGAVTYFAFATMVRSDLVNVSRLRVAMACAASCYAGITMMTNDIGLAAARKASRVVDARILSAAYLGGMALVGMLLPRLLALLIRQYANTM